VARRLRVTRMRSEYTRAHPSRPAKETLTKDANGAARRDPGGDGEKVILKDQVLEVRNVDGRLHVARKAKKPDEWDPP